MKPTETHDTPQVEVCPRCGVDHQHNEGALAAGLYEIASAIRESTEELSARLWVVEEALQERHRLPR